MIRRAFSLLETVVCVVVLGIAVPPTLELVADASAGRADAVNTTRAVLFAEMVLETCVADSMSSDASLGFAAFSDAAAYEAGLQTRLAGIAGVYSDLRMSFDVEIGSLVDSSGAVNAEESENIFRIITVTVTYPSARGADLSMPVSVMLGDF